jgi:hypothetical protein
MLGTTTRGRCQHVARMGFKEEEEEENRHSPDIIAVIVKISLLHLNSGLTMSIFASCEQRKR